MTAAEKLARARDLVSEVAIEMNEEHSMCEHCGHKHYENWTEHQAAQELRAAATKLGRWVNRLEEV
jgi:hypothetical protein